MGDYRKLLAWKAAHELAVECYRTTRTWPTTERYGLTAQLRRAAVSVPSNLAEGAARAGRREFAHHANVALASLSEVEYLLQLAVEVDVTTDAAVAAARSHVQRTGQLTYKLLRSLQAPPA